MTGEGKRRDADKSRQELLDELYYLRDIAGEREQRAQDLAERLAFAVSALHGVMHSRSWRVTRPLRALLHRDVHDRFECRLAALLQAEDASASSFCHASEGRHPVPDKVPPKAAANRDMDSSLRWNDNEEYSSAPPAERAESQPCFFIDVTELALRQGVTGVQRVTREITRALLAAPPQGFTVEPVYAAPGQPYRYARAFSASLTGDTQRSAAGAPIEIRSGDIFLGLDHTMDAVIERADELAAMKAAGVKFWFVLNDTLPLSRPDWFPPEVSTTFRQWFQTIAHIGDGIACISKATEEDARGWLERLQIPREQWPASGWFHLGADGVRQYEGDMEATPEQSDMLTRLHDTPSFLVVGTLEPRKGHAQTLEAFNRLWADGEEVTLVLVGRPGWMTEVIQRRIRHHDEYGQRLFWFMEARDALLNKLYADCTALLAPSEGEGFGLPLIEAARHGLPILCRDLPVFREVTDGHATFFDGLEPESLAHAIQDWLAAQRQGVIPGTADMPRLNWSQSATQLVNMIRRGHRE